MLLLEDVRPPPIVVPATVRPGLAGKVKVHDTLLKARAGGDQVTGLRMAVSEHFLILTNYKKELYKSELEKKEVLITLTANSSGCEENCSAIAVFCSSLIVTVALSEACAFISGCRRASCSRDGEQFRE